MIQAAESKLPEEVLNQNLGKDYLKNDCFRYPFFISLIFIWKRGTVKRQDPPAFICFMLPIDTIYFKS